MNSDGIPTPRFQEFQNDTYTPQVRVRSESGGEWDGIETTTTKRQW